VYQAPRGDNHAWTVELARIAARKLLGHVAAGINPNARPAGEGVPSGPCPQRSSRRRSAELDR
jgi:hypothetical protein